MGPLKKQAHQSDGGTWPPLVDFACVGEIDQAKLDRIREAANAPAEGDPDWVIVDGPGW
jgi:hypothetical protein